MTTLSSIIFIICIIFTFYKIKKYFCKERNKTTNKCIIKRVTLDEPFYSTPSFDFPNIQSEIDMKFIDFSSNLAKEHSELNVTQYCKY